MKKLFFIIFLILTLQLPLNLLAQPLYVITKDNALREYPKFFAPVKALLRYGDILDPIRKENDWYFVRFKNLVGYVHNTAVEKRAHTPTGFTGATSTTTEGEITLAGKGFNPQVERSYRDKYPQLRYDLVDKVERYSISDRELVTFILDGGLSEPK